MLLSVDDEESNRATSAKSEEAFARFLIGWPLRGTIVAMHHRFSAASTNQNSQRMFLTQRRLIWRNLRMSDPDRGRLVMALCRRSCVASRVCSFGRHGGRMRQLPW